MGGPGTRCCRRTPCRPAEVVGGPGGRQERTRSRRAERHGDRAVVDAGWADFPDRVQVLDALDAKGQESDAALIVSPEDITPQPPTGLRTVYVAVSRATQRLTVLTADPTWLRTLAT